jgi:hypothetical protein
VNAEQLAAECEKRGIPVRFDLIITASGLSALLDHGSPDTVRKWRDESKGPKHREGAAPWRNHKYTYDLRVVAAWMNDEARAAAD